MPIRILAMVILLSAAVQAETVSKLWTRGYTVIPEPQEVELKDSDLRFGPQWAVQLGPGVAPADEAVDSLRELLEARYGLVRNAAAGAASTVQLRVAAGSVTPGQSTDPDKQAVAEQAYRLDIGPAGIVINANTPLGLRSDFCATPAAPRRCVLPATVPHRRLAGPSSAPHLLG